MLNHFAGNTRTSWRILRKTNPCVRTSTSSKVRMRCYFRYVRNPYGYHMCSSHPSALSDAAKIPVESDTDDEGIPRISLAEMMEDLNLNDATGGEGADMMTD